ncbi:MAG: hypothetical protein GY801_53485 [bacterium]|nr:hypothetical protein [bacterium]
MHPKISHSFHKKDLLLKHQEQRRKFRQLQEETLQEAKRLARLLVEKFGIETVYLTGPLSYDRFHEGMQLELALEGIPEGHYAKALAHLKQDSALEIALIDLRQADNWTKRSIREKGQALASKAKS